MDVDIEELARKKKRKNSNALPHPKKHLCLSRNRTSGQTKLSTLKRIQGTSSELSGKTRTKENNEIYSHDSGQKIEESASRAETDEFLQDFNRSRVSKPVLNERQINFSPKKVQKEECNIKSDSVKYSEENILRSSDSLAVTDVFNTDINSTTEASKNCIKKISENVSEVFNKNTTSESVSSPECHIRGGSDSLSVTENLNNAFIESDLSADLSLVSDCPEKSDEKNINSPYKNSNISELERNDKASKLEENLHDDQLSLQTIYSVVSNRDVNHDAKDDVNNKNKGVIFKKEREDDTALIDQIQNKEDNNITELESCFGSEFKKFLPENEKSAHQRDINSEINNETYYDAEETETGLNVKDLQTEKSHGDLNDHFDGSFDDLDFSEIFSSDAIDLDLSSWHRCKVIDVRKDNGNKNLILELQSISSGNTYKCTLQGVWKFSNINSGSIVYIKAHFQSSESSWIINNDDGFLVEHPDMLISPTSIVGSISCMRQGVLNYLIKKTDMDENSKLLVSGSLIHELLQQVLSQGNNSPEFIATIIEEIISTPYNIRLLYSHKMSLCEARSELLNVVSNLQKFFQYYSAFNEGKTNNTVPKENDAWKGKIKSVIAVEDNYWIPQLGLKGKVDVTVSAVEDLPLEQLMPLELKTGSAKNSVEHRGQVILYCLMAAEITPQVDGGLLVYLKEGFARKVHVGRAEKRDIILLRNQLVKYLVAQPSSENSSWGNIVLPDPIENSQICKWCPHITICAAFLRALGKEKLRVKGKAHKLRSSSLTHLSSNHIDYIVHWFKLLWEEDKGKPQDLLKNLWTVNPEIREKNGVCLSNLMLCVPVKCKNDHSYFHVLKKKNDDEVDFIALKFSVGQTVLVSTDRRLAMAFGIIIEIHHTSLLLDIPRDLSVNCDLYGDTFIVDVYEFKTNVNWCMGNLASLLDDREESSRLRRLIIDQETPLFDVNFESIELNLSSSLCLNTSQQMSIKKALATQDYLLIRGFPGSGKSFTVAALIHEFVSRGHSVLLTAHTHSAVDTVLLKLLNLRVEFMRIGAISRIHESIHPWSEQNLTKQCHTPQQLETVYKKKPVIATTCWGIKHTLFSRRTFDVCIVDESTQVLQPVIVGPLLRAKRFILVGDPQQLPPVVKSKVACREGLSKCMFTQLDKLEASVELDIQYRMNSKITALANNLTYGGKLKCASLAVANATLSLKMDEQIEESHLPWISRSLCCKLEASVIFINIPKIETIKSQLVNKEEAMVVKKLVEAFIVRGINTDDIGIMAPYRDQVEYLQSILLNVEINTVDQYQGRDKDVVIFSCTNNWSTNESLSRDKGILNDKRRMTVAITRAKVKYIMIGNKEILKAFDPFKLVIDFIDPANMLEVNS